MDGMDQRPVLEGWGERRRLPDTRRRPRGTEIAWAKDGAGVFLAEAKSNQIQKIDGESERPERSE